MCINNNVKLALEKIRKGLYAINDSIDNPNDKKNSELLLDILNGEGENKHTNIKYAELFNCSLDDEISHITTYIDYFFDKHKLDFEPPKTEKEENSISGIIAGLNNVVEGLESLLNEIKESHSLNELLRKDIIYDLQLFESPFRSVDILTFFNKFKDFRDAYLKEIEDFASKGKLK